MDEFTRDYIECMLWTEELDQYDLSDIEEQSLQMIINECKVFQQDNAKTLESISKSECYPGHDFWLTRNGHGAGDWDRGLGGVGLKLYEAARDCGERTIFEQGGKLYYEVV